MAIGSGLGAQLAVSAAESTYGAATTVSRFIEFTDESLQFNKKRVEGLGLRAGGSVARAQRAVVTTSDATGDINFDIPTRGFGLLLSHMTGSTPTPSSVGGAYQYVFTLGDMLGHSFNCQVGAPTYGGTVVPKTLKGAKVANFEIAVSSGAIATCKLGIDAASMDISSALAVASYPVNGSIFHFAQGSISIDGTPSVSIRDFSVSVDNALKVDRYNLGASGAKAEQTVNGFRKITGKFTAEFTDTALAAKYLSDATTALSVTFNGGTGSSLTIALPAIKLDADMPKVTGPASIDLSVSFTVYDDGTNAPVTITYVTADAAL